MRANYPFNCWYVAATSAEVGAGLFARRMLGKHVLLYRQESGEVVAMEDRCAHRPHPLSTGRRHGDRVACAYHGFEYDPDGRLVDVPSQENVPPGVRVRTYPVREQSPFVWVWLGEPGAAELRLPPRLSWLGADDWPSSMDTFRVEANYLLLHEHYLDLTNVFHMHPDAVPPDLHALPALDEVEVSERSVSYSRLTTATRPAAWEKDVTGVAAEERTARLEEGSFVSPGLHVQRYVVDPHGERPYTVLRIQGFTPESEGVTHAFVRIARDFATSDSAVTAYLQQMFHEMAVRDCAALETMQIRIDEETEPRRNINVKADRAALRARRISRDMVDEESGFSI
ncbi:aromatic ring-hydroxylating dioxygenase subunit alpha [Antrihabitans sp. YC2-6]|uniref:aromatic ring-hydroxylating dioxygenase subunit alpha n=1 Tax=Antrihabitans sp. YC2-6 TaxID=2799498 RepID=UPI0018F2A99E|nr:aromatic ring-hydroxylating dioxygenase subunit alpha [Antrihabitans sp. YC2-6]MBJ8344663.1 aromatic ring-hydroxylating dioxygenase subunit alpha [Antrihabitans sp. YC2-6]